MPSTRSVLKNTLTKGMLFRSTQANRAMLRPTREAYGIYPTIQFCILESQRSQELCSTAPPSIYEISLNNQLLEGPDITNTLVGVLTRFCQRPIAFLADIEATFCQVRVSLEHGDFLRFLWWRDSDYEQLPEEYKMLVHLFRATSSPSCTGFCLCKVADEFKDEFDEEMIKTIQKVFYVDDCLKFVQKTEDATQLIEELCQLLAKRSFWLTKFVCNDVKVLSLIPESERVHPLSA